LTISPPLGGVVESTAYQSQPPYTLFDGYNCWPKDSAYRDRLSTRPSVRNFATGGTTTVGSAESVRLLAEVNYATASETTRYLVAGAGGTLYKLATAAGGWTAISSDLAISSANPVQASPFGNKLFIADWDTPDSKTSGTGGVFGLKNRFSISGEIKTSGTQFDDVGLDWTTVCSPDDLLVITSGNSKGVYKIAARTATELTLPTTLSDETGLRYYIIDDPTTAALVDTFVIPDNQEWAASYADNRVLTVVEGDSAGVYAITAVTNDSLTVRELNGDALPSEKGSASTAWAIPRSAKVLDLEAGTLARWDATDAKGVVPHGCKMITTWQDRIVMGNDQVQPHVWYMSRNGSAYDFLYGSEDLGSPVAGNLFQAGLIGEPLTALLAHNKSCLLFGAEDSLWIMRGDPMQGGYIERLSDDVGIVGPYAHTKTDKDATYFLSHVGLYMMPSGCGDIPTPVSRDKIPTRGPIQWGGDDTHMAFDAVHNGILMSNLETATATFTNIWYDLKNGGFWPLVFGAGRQVRRLFNWQPAAGHALRQFQGSLMMGGPDSKVCRFDGSQTTDEGGVAVTANAMIGPIKISQSSATSALIQEIRPSGGGETIAWTGTVTPKLYVGKNAGAAANTSSHSITLSDWGGAAGFSSENPRASGAAVVLSLATTSGHGAWAFDEAVLTIIPLGRAR